MGQKWIRNGTAEDVRMSPTRRLKSSLGDSLGGMTEEEIRDSVGVSTMAHKRFLMDVQQAEQQLAHNAQVAAETGADPEGVPTPVLGPDALDAPETLRRIWASSVLGRTLGK